MKKLFFPLLALCLGLHAASPSLDLDFTTATSVQLRERTFPIHGDGIDTLPDGRKAMLFGSRNALALPAAWLLGDNQGTIIADLAFPKFTPSRGSAWRPLVTVGNAGRLRAAINTFANAPAPFLQFAITDGKHNLFLSTERLVKLEFDRLYTAAIAFDGENVRCFLDGVLVASGKQPAPLPAKSWRSLFVGPFNDGYSNVTGWGPCDTRIARLRCFPTALSTADVAALSPRENAQPPRRLRDRIVIPLISQAPFQIDGRLNESAWTQAAAPILLAHLATPAKSWALPKSQVRICASPEALLVGFSAVFPGGYPLRPGPPPGPEAEAWGHESFELYLVLEGHTYRFAGTPSGSRTERRDLDTGYAGPWQYASTATMRIDDTTLWQAEAAIPWTSLGLQAPPATPFLLNFCRTWLGGETSITALSAPGKGYDDQDSYPEVQIATAPPALHLLEHNDPTMGTLEQKLSLLAPKELSCTLDIRLEHSNGRILPKSIFQQNVPLKAGTPVVLQVAAPLEQPEADRLVYRLTSNDGHEVWLRQGLPVKVNPVFLEATPLFLHERIEVQCRRKLLAAHLKRAFDGHIRLLGPDGKAVHTRPADADTIKIPFPKSSPAGQYRLQLVERGNDRIHAECLIDYPGLGQWFQADDTRSRIIPPFLPIQNQRLRAGRELTLWGRTYRFADRGLFPSSIHSQNAELLAARPALRIGDVDVSADATLHWRLLQPHRCEFTATKETDAWTLGANAWLEYDGVLFYTLTLTARQRLDTIELSIPMRRECARFLHAASTPWGTKLTDAIADGRRPLAFFPSFLLCSQDKGLCFFAESRHGWPTRADHPITLEADGNSTRLNVRFAENLAPGQTIRLEFGLQATPVRPLAPDHPVDYLGNGFHTRLNRPGEPPFNRVTLMGWMEGMTHADCLADLPLQGAKVAAFYRKERDFYHALGARGVTYNMAHMLPLEYPQVAAFLPEWRHLPNRTIAYDRGTIELLCPAAPGSVDFYVDRLKNMLKHTALDGLYFDFGAIESCDNALHGCHGRTPLLAHRDFLRRVAFALHDSGAWDYVIVLHNTDCVQLPSFGFATHLLNGEHIRQGSSSLLHDGKDILDSYRLPMFACELGSLPIGLNNSAYIPADVLLPRFGGGKEDEELYVLRMTRAMMAGTIVHGTLPSSHRAHPGIFDKVARILRPYLAQGCDFLGYWNPLSPVRIEQGGDLYASCWQRDGRLLVAIAHLGKERREQTARLRIQGTYRKAANLLDGDDPGYATLLQLRTQRGVPPYRAPLKWRRDTELLGFDGTRLDIRIAPHSFTLIELQ